MKKGWQARTLGDVATVTAGNSAPQDEALFLNGTIPFFRTSDAGRVRFGDILESGDYLSEQGAAGLRKFPKGTILFPKSGASTFLNHRVMLGVEGCVSSHLATIVADETQAHPRFLLYFLSTVQSQNLIQDHAYPSLNLPIISAINIPVPSLVEQERIVKILDEAFEGIAIAKANAEKNLESVDELFNNFLRNIFTTKGHGWEIRKLSDVAEYFNGLTYSPKDVSNNGVVVLRSANIQDGKLDFSDVVRVSCDVKERIMVQSGDILMCSRNGSKRLVGKTAVIKDLRERMTFGTFMMIVRSQHNSYLKWFFRSADFRMQISRGENTMINQITRYMLDDISVSFPPAKEREVIVGKIEALYSEVQRLKASYMQKRVMLHELKQSLLHQAFTGNL